MLTAFLIWQHAAQRAFGLFGGEAATILSPSWFLGLVEFVASLALLIGFLTRPAALILAVDMALVYLIWYLPQGFPPLGNNVGEQFLALAVVSGFIAFAGPGRFSVDADLARQHPELRGGWFADGLEQYYPQALGAARILIGVLYAQHGLAKLGIGGGEMSGFLTERWIAGVVELFGGMAVALGVFTHYVAFVTSGQMAYAYFLSHAPRGFFPIENGGERAAAFCFFFLVLVTSGSGRWAVDRLFEKKAARTSG
jgi:putative oxidoreductase